MGNKELNTVQDNVSVKEYILSIVDANDKRYAETFFRLEKTLELSSADQKEAVSAAFKAQQEAVNAALAAAKEAVNKAETASEKRFESVNEFRSTLSDQQKNLMPRAEVETKFDYYNKSVESLNKEIASLRESRSSTLGKETGVKDFWGIIVGAIGICIGLAALLSKFLIK